MDILFWRYKMSWHYGLKRNKDGWMELCEIYSGDCYTTTPILIVGDDYQELIDNLRLIVKDLEEPHIIDVQND